MPSGFHRLIAAQFFSALADNALLILAIALLHAQGQPLWWAPLAGGAVGALLAWAAGSLSLAGVLRQPVVQTLRQASE